MKSPQPRPVAPESTPVPPAPSYIRGSFDRPGPIGRLMNLLVAAVWLVFLRSPLQVAWQYPQAGPRYLSVGALIAFAAGYLMLFVWTGMLRSRSRPIPLRHASYVLLGLLALGALSIPAAGGASQATLVYIAASTILMLPRRRIVLVIVLLLAAIPLLTPLAIASWQAEAGITYAVLVASFASFGVIRIAQRNAELVAAQAEIRRLAVAEERARTARDLHDILGHSLTIVAIKAELAGRLIELDPARAATEITDVERLAREALADVRKTVGAYREVSLAGELASARSALSAAGVEADLPASVEEVPPTHSELFGWAVREGVTNVIRHSGARHCTVRVSADRVEVADDGRGPTAKAAAPENPADGGHGLLGLRERAEQLGGRLTVGRAGAGRGFLLQVSLPQEAR